MKAALNNSWWQKVGKPPADLGSKAAHGRKRLAAWQRGDRSHGEVDELNRTQMGLRCHSGKVRGKHPPGTEDTIRGTTMMW